MYKKIIVEPFNKEDNKPNIEVVDFKVKTASDRPSYLKELISKITPEDGVTYVIGNIVGSDEIWGDNNKHDAFPRNQLIPDDPNADYGYKSFIRYGAAYVEHANQSPNLKVGSVVDAIWVPDIERVYILLKLINELIDPQYLDALKKFEVGLSMGCKIEKDICSYCGHEARNESERCEHIPAMLGEVMPDGTKVKMINIHPKFFDATLTLFPADKTAQLLKAASMRSTSSMIKEDTADRSRPVIPATKKKILSEISNLQKATEGIKKRDIDIPSDVLNSMEPDVLLAVLISHNTLPKVKELRKLSSIPKVMSLEKIINKLATDYDNQIPDELASYLAFRSADRQSLMLRVLTVEPKYSDDEPTLKEAGLLSTLLWLIPGYYILKHLLKTPIGAIKIPPNVQLSPSTMSALTNPDFARNVALSRLGIAPPLPSVTYNTPSTIDGLPLAYLINRPSTTSMSKLGSEIIDRLEIENLFSSDEIKQFDMQLAKLFAK